MKKYRISYCDAGSSVNLDLATRFDTLKEARGFLREVCRLRRHFGNKDFDGRLHGKFMPADQTEEIPGLVECWNLGLRAGCATAAIFVEVKK